MGDCPNPAADVEDSVVLPHSFREEVVVAHVFVLGMGTTTVSHGPVPLDFVEHGVDSEEHSQGLVGLKGLSPGVHDPREHHLEEAPWQRSGEADQDGPEARLHSS